MIYKFFLYTELIVLYLNLSPLSFQFDLNLSWKV